MSEVLLNKKTGTIHEYTPEDDLRTVACGAISAIDHDQIEIVEASETIEQEPDRCGRCFASYGGY